MQLYYHYFTWIIGYSLNFIGLKRTNVSRDVQIALRKAFKILFYSGLTIRNAIVSAEKEVEHFEEVEYLLNFLRASKRGVCKGGK